MITDVFHKRYPHNWQFPNGVPREVHMFLRQGAQIIFKDLKPHMRDVEKLCLNAYDKLVRELGHGLYKGDNAEDTCVGALCEAHSIYNDTHGHAVHFVLYRFSLLELLLADIEADFSEPATGGFSLPLFKKAAPATSSQDDPRIEAFRNAAQELNHRLREARIPLHYHNGILQLSTDDVTESHVHEPFWAMVKDPKWQNVDLDIKEAIDRRDRKGRDVALYALKALESTIKIISDDKGWTRGTERGAASYIDNLVSSANGRFIDAWESDNLKAMFGELRNPHGHGPGSAPQPSLSSQQENWTIECSMVWIKSLVSRL